MRYSYVEPAAVEPNQQATPTVPTKFVIEPSHPVELDHRDVPAEARRLEVALRDDGKRYARAYLARAYDAKICKMIVTLSLRTYDRQTKEPLGWMLWQDGHAAHGYLAKPSWRRVGLAEFAAWVRGQAYVPLPPAERGVCDAPDCGADVRIKKDGNPYKHKRPDGSECV